MQMENGLSAVEACVGNDAVTVLVDPLIFCESVGSREDMPHQLLVFNIQGVDRLDMFVRYDQYVRWRDGMEIAEGGHLFVTVNDRGFGFVCNNFTEDAGVGHVCSDPCVAGNEMDEMSFQHYWNAILSSYLSNVRNTLPCQVGPSKRDIMRREGKKT